MSQLDKELIVKEIEKTIITSWKEQLAPASITALFFSLLIGTPLGLAINALYFNVKGIELLKLLHITLLPTALLIQFLTMFLTGLSIFISINRMRKIQNVRYIKQYDIKNALVFNPQKHEVKFKDDLNKEEFLNNCS